MDERMHKRRHRGPELRDVISGDCREAASGTASANASTAAAANAELEANLLRMQKLEQKNRSLRHELQKSFGQLWRSDLLRKDVRARAILQRIERAEEVDDLACEVSLLAQRVAHLLTKGGHAGASASRPASPYGAVRRETASDFRETTPSRSFFTL